MSRRRRCEREPGVAHPTATRSQLIERRVRRTAAARGLDEAVTWSFISEEEAALFGGGEWRLANPISEEMKVMRPSLLPGLLAAARRNLDRGAASVRLFEVGRRYLGDGEHPTVSLLLAGEKSAAALAVGQGARFRRTSMSRPRRWRCLRPRERRPRTCSCSPTPGRPGTRAARRRSGSGRRPSSPHSASCTRAWRRTLEAPAGAVAAEIYLDAIPAPRSSGRARPAFAPPALAGGHPRLRLLSSRTILPPTRWSARSAAPTRLRSPQRGCSTGSSAGGAVAGCRSHAAAGREELHRGRDRRHRQADRRRRRKAGRALRASSAR